MASRSLTKEQEELLSIMYLRGDKKEKIQEIFGISGRTIYNTLRRIGVAVRKVGYNSRPESKPRKISEKEICAVGALYADGKKISDIAEILSEKPRRIETILSSGMIQRRKISERARKYNVNKNAFIDAECSEEAAYFVGLIMADGCVKHKDGKPKCLSLSLASGDGYMVERLAAFVGGGLRISTVPGKINKAGVVSQESKRVDINCIDLVRSLERYGVLPRKSLTARPEVLCDNRHFWRGMIDGDGFVTRSPASSEKSLPVIGLVGSLDSCNMFMEFVKKRTRTKAGVSRMGKIWCFRIKGSPAVDIARVLYADQSISLERKSSKAQGFFS